LKVILDNKRRCRSVRFQFEKIAELSCQEVCLSLSGLHKNQPRILIGSDARFIDLLQRFDGREVWTFVRTELFRIQFSSSHRQACSVIARLAPAITESPDGRFFANRAKIHRSFRDGRRTRPQMRNCASGNLEILRCAIAHRSSMLRIAPE
jgi:hypothetical protein